MTARTNFFGKAEEVPDEINKLVAGAPALLQLPLVNVETGVRSIDGHIRIHQRGKQCLALNNHDPRPYIVCWHSLHGNTDISLHLRMGGDFGALNAARRMFENYTEHRV